MQITLTNTGKRYNREWIFRHLDHTFTPGKAYAITGANGSGKSTLLQVIAGATLHSEGTINYTDQPVSSIQHPVSNPSAYKNISIAAPYLELIEEMTTTEFLKFHNSFKNLNRPINDILDAVSLLPAANKQIRYFSSGMKQRLKLAQAFFSDTTVLLLDEPTTNLDAEGIALYKSLIKQCSAERLVIVSSNDRVEFDFCDEEISIGKFK